MALNPATYSTRSLSLLMLAAFAGVALWMAEPSGFGLSGQGSGGASPGAQLPSSLKVDGVVEVETHDNIVTQLVVPLTLRGTPGIALDGARLRAETAMSETASAAVPTTHMVSWLDGNGDQVLDPGEHALLTIDLPAVSTVHPGNPLNLVVTTADGAALVIEDVLGN